jgi:predicted nucleotidyltransferase
MQTTTKAFLKEITEKIVRSVSPQKIVLFGSYARGEENAESDLDILIYTSDEVLRWSSSLNHIIPTALREGIVLYER